MKLTQTLLLTLLITLSAFSVVTYTACKKDPCKDISCLNGGTCVSGLCQCPAGFEGDICGQRSSDRFVGVWKGSSQCTSPLENVTYFFIDSTATPGVIVVNLNGIGITGTITSPTTVVLHKTTINQGRVLDSARITHLPASDQLSVNFYFTWSGNGQSTSISCTGTYKSGY